MKTMFVWCEQFQSLFQEGGGCLLEALIIRKGFKSYIGNKNKRRN
jgi:hypothetical protein